MLEWLLVWGIAACISLYLPISWSTCHWDPHFSRVWRVTCHMKPWSHRSMLKAPYMGPPSVARCSSRWAIKYFGDSSCVKGISSNKRLNIQLSHPTSVATRWSSNRHCSSGNNIDWQGARLSACAGALHDNTSYELQKMIGFTGFTGFTRSITWKQPPSHHPIPFSTKKYVSRSSSSAVLRPSNGWPRSVSVPTRGRCQKATCKTLPAGEGLRCFNQVGNRNGETEELEELKARISMWWSRIYIVPSNIHILKVISCWLLSEISILECWCPWVEVKF